MAQKTRKINRKTGVLSVRSPAAVKSFERLLTKGPLTLVYVNAKWCGACHQFTDKVWNSLTKLKNKNMNLASVDSEVIGKTSLASVPRKFFPTLMLVGKDGKPATFKDESGLPTNAMPRKNTLSEDKDAFTSLVQNGMNSSMGVKENRSSITKMSVNLTRKNSLPRANNRPNGKTPNGKTPNGKAPNGKTPNGKIPNGDISSLARSPFKEDTIPSVVNEMESLNKPVTIKSMSVPSVADDLVASQTKSPTSTSGVVGAMKGGKMLRAIRNKTMSLKAMLKMRKHTRKAKY